VQVLRGQAAACVVLAGRDNSILRIKDGEDNLAGVGTRGSEAALAQMQRQLFKKAMDDTKDLFG